jgi:hypothetical protein
VTNRECELALRNDPNLFLDIPDRQVFLALRLSATVWKVDKDSTHQTELHGLALSSFEVWFLVPPQMTGRLLDLGLGVGHVLPIRLGYDGNSPAGEQQRRRLLPSSSH